MIELQHVSKTYGDRHAVADLSLRIGPGELVVLIGPSGSGKSTTLRLINRLVEFDTGSVRFAGQDIRAFAPEVLRRRMGYAIQSVGLFPHWTVAKNIGTVPRLLGWPAARIAARVQALLELLQLDPGQFARRYPHELSGGQQQRVGVARALAADPEVLLMDEPFGALDPVTRVALQQALKRIHALSGKTIVLVTHDIDEALYLGSRIVLLRDGRLVQDGSPLALLTRPADDFVTDFLGRSELGLKRLALGTVADRLRAGDQADGEPLRGDTNLREALSAFFVQGRECLPVVDARGQHLGALHLTDLLAARPADPPAAATGEGV
ncbi:MAG: ABC transporter ATP-binding protein [Hydrogenophaga sp.]|nr:ABC transporter ATP-binding protein [Hydrogenophaga sp.]